VTGVQTCALPISTPGDHGGKSIATLESDTMIAKVFSPTPSELYFQRNVIPDNNRFVDDELSLIIQ
jgi:hypothetical protein